jgi:ATP-binding cassette subfamily B protein
MDHGRIIERGTHSELLAQKGKYYQLYTGNQIN